MDNPFSLTFGKEPAQMIDRYSQSNEILSSFEAENPSQQVYMITGVRGSGKTVFMSSIARKLSNDRNWIVIELNSSGEMLKELASKLYNVKGLAAGFKAEGINLSFWGIGLNIKKAAPITDLGTAVERMLERVAKDNKRVLVTIDEVSNSQEMRYFAGEFQILIRHDLPLYLLMTGLYENINRLQNEDNLTFLYRAPKIYLSPLNPLRIADRYEKLIGLSKEEAGRIAKITQGYSFAFQVFGYFIFNKKGNYEEAFPEIRQYLDEFVYDKIWMELTEKETALLAVMAYHNTQEVSMIKEKMDIKPNEFSVYRDRLIKKGILDGTRRGKLSFALPFFDDYVSEHCEE